MAVKVLVAYDGSEPAQRALVVAAELTGRSRDVDVGAVHVVSPRAEPGIEEHPEQDELLREARIVGEAGSSASTLRPPAKRRPQPDRDGRSRGRGSLKTAVLGSFSSTVAAQEGCPVVIVPPGAGHALTSSRP